MEITRIGNKNHTYFSHLMGGQNIEGYEALGVIDEGEAIGAAVFKVEGNICFLEHIEVDEGHRRQGAGTLLFNTAKDAMIRHGIEGFLTYYEDTEEVDAFIMSLGFTCTPSDQVYAFKTMGLTETEQFIKLSGKAAGGSCRTYDELAEADRKELMKAGVKAGFSEELFQNENYTSDLSIAYLGKDGQPAGLLLAKELDDIIDVTMLFVAGGSDPMTALTLISELGKRLDNKDDPEQMIRYIDKKNKVTSLLEKVFADEIDISTKCRVRAGYMPAKS